MHITTYLPRLFISISIVVLLSVMVNITNSQLHAWRIDVGTPSARVFTTELREPESAEINGNVVTFQWSFPHSTIIIPPYNHPQIIRLRTMMRAESPPKSIKLSHDSLQFALSIAPQPRQYAFYANHNSPISINCDMQGVIAPELDSICVAIDWIGGKRVTQTIDWNVVGWTILLGIMIFSCAWVVTNSALSWQMMFYFTLMTAIICGFPLYSILFAPHICIGLGLTTLIWWSIKRWVTHDWQQIACQAMLVNMMLKGFGVFVPGYFGTDLFFHVNRFTHAMNGMFYLVAHGRDQFYPYPPGVYQLIAPIVLPLMTVIPSHQLIIALAVLLDTSTIILLAWMCQSLGWSRRSITFMSWLYVILPAGFLLHWQATVSQNIGQWLGMMAITTSLMRVSPMNILWMVWATVGHFGAFLSLLLTNAFALTFISLRRIALWWWVVVIFVSIFFYSQYTDLILSQLSGFSSHNNQGGVINGFYAWWDQAWRYGIYGHYLAIGLALAIVGLCLAPRDNWWKISIAMVISTSLFFIAQVGFGFNVTRYMIFIFPVVSSFAGITIGRLYRRHAGRIMVYALLGYIAWNSCFAWFNGTLLGVRMGYLW